jgi:hypothetical protein
MKREWLKSSGEIIMKMRSHLIFSAFVLALVFASVAGGSYAGDKPLNTLEHGEIYGGVFFTLGDSKYSGGLNYNDTYTVNFDTSMLKSGKEVELARLYVYWVWSQRENVGVFPSMVVSDGRETLRPVATYTDTKGFVGRYDYFSGVYVYDCNITKTGYSVTVKNVDANGSTFCLQGIGPLVIYECQDLGEDCQLIEYWVNEGCDMIYAEYGITPEMATSKTYFGGDVDRKAVNNAYLITVAPSGGYVSAGETAHNRLYFNEESGWLTKLPFLNQLLRLLFGYGGGTWSDVYITSDIAQIGVDQRDVTDYLKETNNFAAVQDNHDYMMLTNAVLVVEKGEGK